MGYPADWLRGANFYTALISIILGAKCINFEAPNEKTALIASENVRKSRKSAKEWKKTRKMRGNSAKRGKKRRNSDKKRFRDLPARKKYY